MTHFIIRRCSTAAFKMDPSSSVGNLGTDVEVSTELARFSPKYSCDREGGRDRKGAT